MASRTYSASVFSAKFAASLLFCRNRGMRTTLRYTNYASSATSIIIQLSYEMKITQSYIVEILLVTVVVIFTWRLIH